MKTVVQAWQPLIQQEIIDCVSDFSAKHSRFDFDHEQLNYLQELSLKGKQFRGCLLAGFYSFLKPALSDAEKKIVARLAAAIELHGTAILIHDDIIDKSDTRRSLPTGHKVAAQMARNNNFPDEDHFGVGAAICLGDVLFFLADKTVAELNLPAEIRVSLAAINGEELALLGLAEIEDMRLSSSKATFSREDIVRMFAGKTGRYTGRWPLHLACVLAGLSEEEMEKIVAVGEDIGILYQLKDDELGLFGNEAETGKSTTSDITDGKKTFYYLYAQQDLSESEQATFFSIVGNPNATEEETNLVKKILTEKGIQSKVHKEIVGLQQQIIANIKLLDVPVAAQQFLEEVTEFVVSRNK